jgi:ComF family protein
MESEDALCGLCRRKPPLFRKATAFGGYEGGLRDLIHLLKYDQVLPAARTVGAMLAQGIGQLNLGFEGLPLMVVPVPLYRSKLRQRGFNQAELIARHALKVLARPGEFQLMPEALWRIRETQSQIGLTRHQRRLNLRGAFVVTKPEAVTGRDVLLVDDVYTTGTTAGECTRVLLKAGARRVWVVTVARTMKLGTQPTWQGDFEHDAGSPALRAA